MKRFNLEWFPIIIMSIIFSIPHMSSVEPGWVRFIQILPFGAFTGILYFQRGVFPCIAFHWYFNMMVVIAGLVGILAL